MSLLLPDMEFIILQGVILWAVFAWSIQAWYMTSEENSDVQHEAILPIFKRTVKPLI